MWVIGNILDNTPHLLHNLSTNRLDIFEVFYFRYGSQMYALSLMETKQSAGYQK